MTLNEMMKLFLDSRKRGVGGARKKCTDKSIKIYTDNLNLFLKFMAERFSIVQYSAVKRTNLIEFYDWMAEKVKSGKWSLSTELQVLRTLRAFFRWVDKDEDCREMELKGIQRWLPAIEQTPQRTDMPQITDLKRFKNSFDTNNPWHFRNYVASCLMMTNGIRVGELCNLTLDHTHLEDLTIIVTGKTGTRLVPITREMATLLRAWIKRRQGCVHSNSPYVFVSRNGPQMEVDGFVKAFIKHRNKHKLGRISAHSFRHAFCTHYLENGGDIERLRNITGHTDYKMLINYLHLSKVKSKAAHEELEKVNLLKEL